MFIKDGKRFNPYATQVVNGVTYRGNILKFPEVVASLGITEVPDPVPPADYSEDTYFRTETEDAPYVIYEKKPQEQLAKVRKAKVHAARDNLLDTGGCKVEVSNGVFKWFHTDVASKLQQLTLAVLGNNLPAGISWKTMDGSFVTLTPPMVSKVLAAQVARENQVYTVAEQKAVDSTDINTGWPERYVKPEEGMV